MAWKTMDVQEQRVRFVVEATQKLRPFVALCVAYDISRPTGYLWLQRYREQGVAGIAEQSRNPHHSPRRTGGELERQVTELRLRYPDWGARKLQVLLTRQGVQLPRNTIHRILRRHDLIGEPQRGAAAVQRFERGQPNELWQMDFKGPKGWRQPMGPLSVLDDHSRYLIALAALGGTHGGPVQLQLEEAFQRCGVPAAMLMDHGTPWWSTSAQFGRTQLSLWLMRQGIRLYWSGIRHPQTQGKVERFHGSLQRAWERRGVPGQNRQAWLDAYRWEHNHVRPHEALGMRTPATLWKPSLHRYDPHPPRWEYPTGAWVLKVDCQGKLDIKGRKWKINRSLAGEWVQVVHVEQRMMVFYCSTLIRELDPGIQRSKIIERWIPVQVQTKRNRRIRLDNKSIHLDIKLLPVPLPNVSAVLVGALILRRQTRDDKQRKPKGNQIEELECTVDVIRISQVENWASNECPPALSPVVRLKSEQNLAVRYGDALCTQVCPVAAWTFTTANGKSNCTMRRVIWGMSKELRNRANVAA